MKPLQLRCCFLAGGILFECECRFRMEQPATNAIRLGFDKRSGELNHLLRDACALGGLRSGKLLMKRAELVLRRCRIKGRLCGKRRCGGKKENGVDASHERSIMSTRPFEV